MQELDMEVTDERLSYMKNLLAMLYADQIGAEIKSINVRPVGKGTERRERKREGNDNSKCE